ncbi:MAG: hypothetical protein BGO05_10095 [Rhizobiales bacterium 63-7]|nr:hypothetical protein [Hyphomicrobiales bacterium]OJU66190.1 MAG: hypothetical protein BGO05_10095 [Rhizobiales bacterium 63-7]
MTNLPENFTSALNDLMIRDAFTKIITDVAVAGREFSVLRNSDADNRAIFEGMAKTVIENMASLVWLAGGDMDAFGSACDAFSEGISDAFEPTTLTQAEIRRAYRNRPTLIAAE